MHEPGTDFFLAVAGAIPLLLIVATTEKKLTFAQEAGGWTAVWLLLLGSIVAGEVAALGALAWGPNHFELVLASVGICASLAVVLILFLWQFFEELGYNQPASTPLAGPTRTPPSKPVVWASFAFVLGALVAGAVVAFVWPIR